MDAYGNSTLHLLIQSDDVDQLKLVVQEFKAKYYRSGIGLGLGIGIGLSGFTTTHRSMANSLRSLCNIR